MGEKLLAQRMLALLRENTGRHSREALAALEWANDQRDWLWPGRSWADETNPGLFGRGGDTLDWERLPRLLRAIDTAEPEPPLFACLRAAAELLALEEFDRRLLQAVAGFERLPRLSNLRSRLVNAETSLIEPIGCLAGAPAAEAAARVRRSDLLTLGLVRIDGNPGYGSMELQLHWAFARLLDAGSVDEARLTDALAGVRQTATLAPGDFAEHEEAFALLVRLLEGALPARASGVNILVHGPPGTGKTELARTLAAAAGADLFAVGEADVDGDEPTRLDRLQALQRAQRLLARRGGSVLLFDEMEDLFSEAAWSADGGRRSGSKIYVNRLLEEVPVPVIWTSNSLEAIDAAHLRRMSFVLRMEITQVNEMLTWMDSHPLPFVAATNYARRLDPAALRRFVFKIELQALSAEAAARAFARFFGAPAPAALNGVAGLTPGDFAVVKRQLRFRGEADAGEIVALLAAEARAKPERPAKIGF